MNDALVRHYLDDSQVQFRKTKALADRAMEQISEAEFFAAPDEESNNIAIIVKHVAGNLRSRWTDFLTSDGEKEWRRRDTEFVLEEGDTRASLRERWEEGWQILFDALAQVGVDEFDQQVIIRGEPHTIVQAINRQLAHYSYHVGQIVFLAKHLKAADWQTLSVPRGHSEIFRQKLLEKYQGQPVRPASGES